nr:taste receptor type 2 member 4-like [Pogona vitticeps]
MSSPQISALLVARIILSLGGIISNSFIIATMIKKWAKCRRLASNDQLLLSLGLSNFCASALEIIFYLPRFWTGILLLFPPLYFFSFIVVMSRFWFTAWLCIFYCIKIMSSTHPLFIQCKLRISWLIPRLLVGSLLISIFIFPFRNVFVQTQMNITTNATNGIKEMAPYGFTLPLGGIFFVVASGCPLLVVLLCSILVVASLCKHIRRMTDKESCFQGFQTEGHVKAARTVLSLLFIYISFYVAHTLSVTMDWADNGHIFVTIAMTMYSPAQAFILLMVNPKLKQAAARILERTRP